MESVSSLLTYEEWLRLPPTEGIDEVVKGELILMPICRYPHPEVISRLNRQFMEQRGSEKISVLSSYFGLMISREPLTCRSPDLILFWKDEMRIVDGLYCSPPGLIVEVLSPSENRRRQASKLEDYASIGVPEVWFISPEAHSVEVQRLRDGKLERTAILMEGSIEPSRFPGVSVDIPSLFPE
ncbi:MAG TPA: Uma2 family endonuclease [Bryobacteraceae bacterium]|jgi:Uma2 family endonuclease